MTRLSIPYASIWVPLLAGLLLLPVPLLGDFHIESALLAAAVGCFWAAVWACRPVSVSKADLKRIIYILWVLYLAGVPLFLISLFTGCFSWHGLFFWILYPAPSVLFGYAIGRILRIWKISFRKTIVACILLFIAIGITAIQFFNLPQVYFFNHVWGGWPGPVYDETVRVSCALLFFRMLTLAWAGLFWWLPAFSNSVNAKILTVVCAAVLAAGYMNLPRLDIISPRSYLQEQLGGVKETRHFILYYDTTHYSNDEITLAALEHEFYLQQITEVLKLRKPDTLHKIESYLYGHAWQKNRLTGAKFTSYVPVWLEQDQLHIAKQQLSSLKHELVHILAKQFGNAVLNASWSIGLVEGLAVALAPNVSSRSTIHQIVAAEKPWPDAAEMKNALSLTGFYGGRSAVNYTTTGSFIRFLLNQYPVTYFKKAYKNANIAEAYPRSFQSLINEWHAKLAGIVVDSTDRQIAARLFSIPSLFEQACPHVLLPFARHWDRYLYFSANKDTTAALQQLAILQKLDPQNRLIKNRRIFLSLKTGKFNQVLFNTNRPDSAIETKLLIADAFALQSQWAAAEHIIDEITAQSDTLMYLLQQAVKMRQNRIHWNYYLDLAYKNAALKSENFNKVNDYFQLFAIADAIDKKRWNWLKRYTEQLDKQNFEKQNFDLYLKIVHYLGYRQRFSVAEKWIDKIAALKLRKRYRRRLTDEAAWIRFLKTHRIEVN